jgi:hypothetical protein
LNKSTGSYANPPEDWSKNMTKIEIPDGMSLFVWKLEEEIGIPLLARDWDQAYRKVIAHRVRASDSTTAEEKLQDAVTGFVRQELLIQVQGDLLDEAPYEGEIPLWN